MTRLMGDATHGQFVGYLDIVFDGTGDNDAFNMYVMWYLALQHALNAHFTESGWTVPDQGGVVLCLIDNGTQAVIFGGGLSAAAVGGAITGPVDDGYFIRANIAVPVVKI